MKTKELINILSNVSDKDIVILDHQEEFKICCIKYNHEKSRVEINVATPEELEEARDRVRRSVIHLVEE